MSAEQQQHLYDEFGNYIGPEVDSSEESDEMSDVESLAAPEPVQVETPAVSYGQLVAAEDKKYYPDASDVYAGAETLVEEEDTMLITESILPPTTKISFEVQEPAVPLTTFNWQYLAGLMEQPRLMRNVAVVGHLHSGKTLLLDMLISASQVQGGHQTTGCKGRKDVTWRLDKETKYTDSR